MGEMGSYDSNSRKFQFFRFSYVVSHTLPHVLMRLYMSVQNNVHACLYWPCPLSSTLDSILSLHLPLPDPSPPPFASQTPSKITNAPVQLIGCYVGRGLKSEQTHEKSLEQGGPFLCEGDTFLNFGKSDRILLISII